MRKPVRIVAFLLCLVLLAGFLFTGGPVGTPVSAAETEGVPEPEAINPTESSEPVTTEATEPVVTTEATEPIMTTEPTEPIVTTEPTEPIVTTEPTEPIVTTEPTEPIVTTEPTEEPTDPTEPPEPPLTEMTDEQIIAKFNIPDNWARAALIFAVRNGILAGRGDNDLAPKENTTHAELAAILICVLKTEKKASITKYTDVNPNSWYADWMAKAVSLGLLPIADPNATTLTPHTAITREEAFVALARLFGVHGQGRQAIYNFADWKDVSDWAAEDVSAMIEAGCVAGSGDKILPQENITRRELAQVFYRLLTKIGTEIGTQDFTGQMGLGSDTVPANTTIHGDLLLSTDTTSITLEGLTVTNRLILQGNDKLNLTLQGCSIGHLVVCRDTELWSDTPLHTVTNYKFLKLHCNADTINNYKTLILPDAGCTINTVNAYAGSGMTNNSVINTVNVYGDNVYINGSGSIGQLNLKGQNLTNVCATGTTVNVPYNTVDSITATRTDTNVATKQNPNVTMTLRLTNMPEGWSECDLSWYVDSSLITSSTRNLLKEGSSISATYNFSQYLDGFHTEVLFTVYITVDGANRLLYRGYVNVEESVREIAESVRTQNVQGRTRSKAHLYTTMGLSTVKKRNIPSGTQVTVLQSRSSSATQVRLSDGTVGWMAYSNVAIVNGQYYVTTDYSTAVKEYYVNNIRNWSSSKRYMIWVSLYTQRVNIFQGSKGNWTLVRSGPIGSGRNDCPTPVETASLQYHTTWYYPLPNNNPPFYCHHVTVFDEARGFHSRPTKWGEPIGNILYYGIGYPCSHGCIRLLDEDCIYISDVLPIGTTVHIY